MKAIETFYGGCRFRSRLEARWAVFFDYLDIPWLYEPQGYQIGNRYEKTVNYLPDFWLPRDGLWAEVKGQVAQLELEHLCWATLDCTGLPKNPSGHELTDAERNRPRILLLGSIPRITEYAGRFTDPYHYCFAHHKGDVELLKGSFRSGPGRFEFAWSTGDQLAAIWNDCGEWFQPPDVVCKELVAADNHDFASADATVRRAYYAASRARFEFGESS